MDTRFLKCNELCRQAIIFLIQPNVQKLAVALQGSAQSLISDTPATSATGARRLDREPGTLPSRTAAA